MPATNGNRMSLRSHNNNATTTKVASQNASCRSKLIKTSVPPRGCPRRKDDSITSFSCIHVPHPLCDIEGDRQQGQGRHQCNQRIDHQRNLPAERERGENDSCK